MGFDEWFMVWCGLEMNMFGFLSMMYQKDGWRELESLYKYFFIQGVSSGGFLVMIMLGWGLEFPLMMSMAAGPFYFWLPSVMEGLNWVGCYVLMTLQKVLPLMLINGMVGGKVMVWGLVGMVIGVFGSYGQQMASSMMAYSSVNHVGWMMVSQVFCEGLWMFYFFMYAMVVGLVVFYFNKEVVSSLVGGGGGSFILMVFVLSMGGVPPFLGFLMKWVVLERVMGLSIIISVIMIFSSLVMVYIYFRLIYDSVMLGGWWSGWVSVWGGGSGWMVLVSLIGVSVVPVVVWFL